MLMLTSTGDQLQIVTDAAATVDAHATWVDIVTSSGAVTPGRTNTAITTAATTSVAGSPASTAARNVKTLHVRNKHATLACNVTVRHTDGTTVIELVSVPLPPGTMVEMTDQGGFALTRI